MTVIARFEQYQTMEKMNNGVSLSNTAVVLTAINHSAGAFEELARKRNPSQEDSGQLFAIRTPGRRVTKERRKVDQLSWRPTYGEIARVDKIWEAARFPNRSAFVEATLDAFLPPLKPKPPKIKAN
ncbi:hypothetical protein I5Q34_33990 [Streptomyces sp. AV19]|uniref:hypothetical protein n=1 Tax=Streptomyces sp. AV19 TaxID=2793068 RepID=UPI0018FED779|nr:hypothetical protein [Streptomyces sp. AV19]MBH1939212.1 hypothetical protein [Streptomyces sp. AV19]MDG4537206.1 hypothetical protein [Streptomyces sp. AV19]